MTLNGAIMQLVEMRENSTMPDLFKPYFDKVIETISECVEPSEIPRWISCGERLPEYGQFVLVSINGSVGCDVLMHCNKGIIWHYDGNLVLDSDAWQPLPEAYQEG